MAGVTGPVAPSGGLNPGIVSVSGQRETANGFYVNGSDVQERMNGGTSIVPDLDSVDQFRVLTSNFDPQYGNYNGGIVSVITKSGSDAFHGSAFDFVRNTALDEKNYFSPGRAAFKQQQPGGTLGGPLRKRKMFFFGDYQRTTQRGLGTPVLSLPTAAMRTGDFTAAGLPAIKDPLTGAQIQCNGVLNMICPDRIDPAASTLVGMMPAVTSAGLTNNYQVVAAGQFNVDNFDIKVNYVPSSKSTFFTRYSMSRSHIFDPPALGALDGDATNGGQLGDADSRIQSVGLGGTYSFSSTVLADWNLGFTRQRLGARRRALAARAAHPAVRERPGAQRPRPRPRAEAARAP